MGTGQLEWKESVGLVGGRSDRNEAKALYKPVKL